MKITAHDQTFEVKGLKVTPVSIRCTVLSIPLSIGQFIYRTAHIWVTLALLISIRIKENYNLQFFINRKAVTLLPRS